MPKYSREKFSGLEDVRKAKIILELLYALEKRWTENNSFLDVKTYFNWLDNESDLFRWRGLSESLTEKTTKRQLLNLIVPIERYLKKSLHDGDLKIQSLDHQNKEIIKYPIYVVLDHLRSAFNVGSIFRAAECLGVYHIYLVGYTPTPDDSGVQKTAMGTEDLVSWSRHEHIDEVLKILNEKSIPLVALETSEKAENLAEFSCPSKVAILLGNERFGLEKTLIDSSNYLVQIPMAGQKNSLNVANAFSIVSYHLTQQMKAIPLWK